MSTDRDLQIKPTAGEGVVTIAPGEPETYTALQRSAAFARLRSRSRRYLVWMTGLCLGAFAVTAALAAWAPGLLATRVFGQVDLGVLLAVGLILLPAPISVAHLLYAGRRLDPLAERVRAEFDGSGQ
ncbi:DUF485 domain-containing protein [Nonomuraea sp. NPDC049421]|uniref:DUF485 domain-containing protein n=1 Tax=Nonomuraea sp. NPDC049421 TaxID=3155275 RepID=UPI00342E2EC4